MNEYTQAQINEHIQFVERGKPCSVLLIKKDQVNFAKKSCEDLHCYVETIFDPIENKENQEWVNFWIYKNPTMLEIIKALPSNPNKPIDHFVLGCAFGYSIDSILEFISDRLDL